MIRFTLSTGSLWTYGLNRAFEIAIRTGFDAVELIVDERWDTRQPGYLHRLMDATGAEIASIHAPFWSLRGSKGYRAGVSEALQLADQVGAGTVVVHPESSGKGYGTWLRQHWDQLHDSHRAELAVENMPYRIVKKRPRHRTHRPEQLVRFPAATFDTAHFGLAKVDILDALKIVQPRLKHIHLSDSIGEREHLCPGDGRLPLEAFLRRLAKSSFSGMVVLELSPEALPVQDEDAVIERLRAVRTACLAALGGQGSAERSHEVIVAG